ncbi:MAG: FkbM family methyltransferase [Phycisphaeraceae bacterium]|nr:FkbM family methyltransferase [Phycisphaeraceae bacterium]
MPLIRTLVERLSRGRAIKRHLPPDFGSTPLFVSPDAELKYLKPGFSAFHPELLDLARRFVGARSQVWDIGANVGVFTFAAASRAKEGGVLAVEADIWLAQLLRRSAALPQNVNLPVSVLPVAVSSEIGVASFLIAARGRASNALESTTGRTQMGGVRERVHVPTTTLDALLGSFPRPDVVKIDVEGAELPVLRGAESLLRSVRPVLYIEVGDAQRAEATDLLRGHGYQLFDGESPNPIASCVFNTLAIPAEKVESLPRTLRG